MLRIGLAILLIGIPVGADGYDEAYKLYRKWIKRPSLHKRTLARERLARTGDARALAILAKSYRRAEQPKDQVQYLLASIATENFAEPEHAATYVQWRGRHKAPKDAWLWYLTLVPHMEAHGPEELESIARDSSRNVFLRAAAIEALRFKRHPGLWPLVEELAGKLPHEPTPRAVLLESLAAALSIWHEERRKPEFRAPAQAVMTRMDEAATLERTKIVLGRQFAHLFRNRFVYRSGKRWLLELDFAQTGGKQADMSDYETKKPPTFVGLEASGDRIVYVIDMSDSMLTPLAPRELEKLPRGPATGPARKRKVAANDAWTRAFENVKWDKVKTRFDAARELLKTSLLGLDENQHVFSVLWFGDKAGVLKSTRGMIKPSLANVKRVFAELDRIRAGPKAENRPHGTLRGLTNMHGGLHRAFKLRAKGMVGPGEYVNPATFTKGCDTIFLLTDGDPTSDDWIQADRKDPEDSAGDPETGAAMADSDTLNFQGPYRRAYHLADDVRRLNLFRKCEIHCVGMGEANMSILQRIAGIGKGKAISLRSGG